MSCAITWGWQCLSYAIILQGLTLFSFVRGMQLRLCFHLRGELGHGLFSNAEIVRTLASLADGLMPFA